MQAWNVSPRAAGFTLIELSIVLVIIGLIVGGVLVGQDLIRAAYVRATISQIEKYNTAVNTFYGKYQALPGDMNNAVALRWGFTPRGSGQGQGDGNGIIEGAYSSGPSGTFIFGGETEMFWVDLTTANGLKLNLIDGGFSINNISTFPTVSATQVSQYLPAAKLGSGNYVYVWSGAWGSFTGNGNGQNYYGIAAVTGGDGNFGGQTVAPQITVQQAYNIDRKMDDGLPQAGRVLAMSVNGFAGVANQNLSPPADFGGPTNTATPGDPTTCYDNRNGSGPQTYSTEINNGASANCALSFQFQ